MSTQELRVPRYEPRPSPTTAPLPVVQMVRNGRLLRLRDERGGEALVDMASAVPVIVDWHSVPDEKRYSPEEPDFKRRGFARLMLGALAQLGVTQFSIPLQSGDSRRALARLTEQEILTPVEGFVGGISVDEHPTRFRLHASKCPAVHLDAARPVSEIALLRGETSLARPEVAINTSPQMRGPELP